MKIPFPPLLQSSQLMRLVSEGLLVTRTALGEDNLLHQSIIEPHEMWLDRSLPRPTTTSATSLAKVEPAVHEVQLTLPMPTPLIAVLAPIIRFMDKAAGEGIFFVEDMGNLEADCLFLDLAEALGVKWDGPEPLITALRSRLI
jgi:hypothetical protein